MRSLRSAELALLGEVLHMEELEPQSSVLALSGRQKMWYWPMIDLSPQKQIENSRVQIGRMGVLSLSLYFCLPLSVAVSRSHCPYISAISRNLFWFQDPNEFLLEVADLLQPQTFPDPFFKQVA